MNYNLVAQTPQYNMESHAGSSEHPHQLVASRATRNAGECSEILATSHSRAARDGGRLHYNIRRVVDIYGAVQDRDLGAVGRRRGSASFDAMQKSLPRGTFVSLRGQVQTMRSSYIALLGGLVFAIVLVYMLIVVNFQSLARSVHHHHRAARGAGRHRALSLPHPHHAQRAGADGRHHVHGRGHGQQHSCGLVRQGSVSPSTAMRSCAAIEAGATRFRPVCMTALAMIIGMVPMALGLGDGGEQNAPLGRAVIGGLLCATVATLVFVPAVFCLLHRGSGEGTRCTARSIEQQPQHA